MFFQLIFICELRKLPLRLHNPITNRMVHWGSHELDQTGCSNFQLGVEALCCSRFRHMGFSENANPAKAALQARRIGIVGLVGTIGYQMHGSAMLGVIRTVVGLVVSKPAIRIEVD